MKFVILGAILLGLLALLLLLVKKTDGRKEEPQEKWEPQSKEKTERTEEDTERWNADGKKAKYYKNRIRGPQYEDAADRDTGLGCMVLFVQVLIEMLFAFIAFHCAFKFGGGLMLFIGAEIIGISFILQRIARRLITTRFDKSKIKK